MKKGIKILLTAFMVVSLVGINIYADDEVFTVNVPVDNETNQIIKIRTEDGDWQYNSIVGINPGTVVYVEAIESLEDGKQFWKWTYNGMKIGYEDSTNRSTKFTFTGGTYNIDAMYKSEDDKIVKYYSQNIYTDNNGNVVTEDPVLANETFPNEFFTLNSSNKDKNKYSQDKKEIYKYENEVIGDKLGLSDLGFNSGDNYVFVSASEDVLVKFYYVENLEDGYYRIKVTNDNIVTKVNGNETKQAKPDDVVEISISEYPENEEFSSWNVVLGTQRVDLDNSLENPTSFVMPDGDVIVGVRLKPEGAYTCHFIFEQYYDDEYFTGNDKYKIGGVDPITDAGEDTRIYNGEVYKLKKVILTDDKDYSKEYTLSDFKEKGSVEGYYTRYENENILPNIAEEMYYRAYYEKRASVGSKEEVISLLPKEFEELDIQNIILNVGDGEVSTSETESINSAAADFADDNNEAVINKVFDLTLYAGFINSENKDDAKQITDLNGETEFSIYLSDDEFSSIADTDNVKIARIHNNETSILDAKLIGNELKFASDGFSTYAIVSFTQKAKNEETKKPSNVAPSSETNGSTATATYSIPKTGIE